MANDKLLRSNVTLLLAYPEYAANPLAPTAAELNSQFAWTPTASQGNMVFNVSAATKDDYTFNQTDSDTDDTRVVTDVSQVSNPTFINYEVSLDFLRDSDILGQGVFNMAREVTATADLPMYAIRRIGTPATTAFAVGDTVTIFSVNTDFPQEGVDSGEIVTHGARFKPSGSFAINYKLVA